LTAQRDRASKPTVPSTRTSDAQGDEFKRSPDNVRQDECWFSHIIGMVPLFDPGCMMKSLNETVLKPGISDGVSP
jgi:hypothetical protein